MTLMKRIQQMSHSHHSASTSNKARKHLDDVSECSQTELSVTTNDSDEFSTRNLPISSPNKLAGRRNLFIRCKSVPVISPVSKQVKAGKSWKISSAPIEDEPDKEDDKTEEADAVSTKTPTSKRPTLTGDPGSSRRLMSKQHSLRYLAPPSKDFERFHQAEGETENDPGKASPKLLGHSNSPRRKFLKQASDRYLSSPRKEYGSLAEAIDDFEKSAAMLEDVLDSPGTEEEKPKEPETEKGSSAHTEICLPSIPTSPRKIPDLPSSPRRIMKKKACARYLSTPRKKFSSLQDAVNDYEEVSQSLDDPLVLEEQAPTSFPRSPGVFKDGSRPKTKRIAIRQSSSRILSSHLKKNLHDEGTTETYNGKCVRRIRISASAAADIVEHQDSDTSNKAPVTPKSAGRRLFKQLSMRFRSPGKKAHDDEHPKTPTTPPRKVRRNTSMPVKSPRVYSSKGPTPSTPKERAASALSAKSPRTGLFKKNSARYLTKKSPHNNKKGSNLEDTFDSYDKLSAIESLEI